MNTTALVSAAKSIKLPAGLSKAFRTLSYRMNKKAPEIMFGTGCVSMILSLGTMYKASLEVNEIVETANSNLEKIQATETDVQFMGLGYTHEAAQRDRQRVIVQTTVNTAKAMFKPVFFASLSIAAFTKSHGIMKNRNASLVAAYAALNKMFNEYRANVVDQYGKDVDQKLRYSVQNETVEETKTLKNGKEKTVTKKVNAINKNKFKSRSEYARIFDESSIMWSKSGEKNAMKIRAQEAYFNDLIRSRAYTDIFGKYHPGTLTLNEVYSGLGLEKSKAGQTVGWTYYGPGHENERCMPGDNHVIISFVNSPDFESVDDFNMRDVEIWDDTKIKIDNNYLLDFNPDGVITDEAFFTEF